MFIAILGIMWIRLRILTYFFMIFQVADGVLQNRLSCSNVNSLNFPGNVSTKLIKTCYIERSSYFNQFNVLNNFIYKQTKIAHMILNIKINRSLVIHLWNKWKKNIIEVLLLFQYFHFVLFFVAESAEATLEMFLSFAIHC